ncbi:myb/SANT-like DNA-binding domain-containing protein 2 isoform X4 [Lissotriton helveticus]
MAAPCESDLQSDPAPPPLKIPKREAMSPTSPGLSDGRPSLSAPSTPSHSSPLEGCAGGPGLASSPSVSFSTSAACRGMSWTPAETNALIAVWGNERLVEAHYQQLEGSGTLFASKAPGPAMYERVSRALAELGYDRTPSQCRERMKITVWLATAMLARSVFGRVRRGPGGPGDAEGDQPPSDDSFIAATG